ncbi:MAG: 3-isopropylmalate dehydratase [Planctomycetes bacterium]|nr:3-isopropylmalate dehydratase [Planctomycetota bacterium]
MEYKDKIKGRVWVMTDPEGNLFPNIDTDMIFHNSYLAITDINEMGQYIFDNLEGWEDFAKKAQPGDIVIAGSNFGCGSSRQQAVDGFVSLGIQALITESFGAIYFRNAVNMGFPLIRCSDLDKDKIRHMSEIEIDLNSGEIKNADTGDVVAEATPLSVVQKDILKSGSLFKYGKTALG